MKNLIKKNLITKKEFDKIKNYKEKGYTYIRHY